MHMQIVRPPNGLKRQEAADIDRQSADRQRDSQAVGSGGRMLVGKAASGPCVNLAIFFSLQQQALKLVHNASWLK